MARTFNAHSQLYRRAMFVVTSLVVIGLLVIGVTQLTQPDYQLTVADSHLIGSADTQLMAKGKFGYDSRSSAYYLNRKALSNAVGTFNPDAVTVGDTSADAAYSLEIHKLLNKGITVQDNKSNLSLTLKPMFTAANAKLMEDHLVYPLNINGAEAVYTVKRNGLQENIILNKPLSQLQLKYKLSLPTYLSAREIGNGAIGIYSADPALFGNISYGSSQDQLKVAEAKLKSPKNYLVFALLPPVIKAAGTPDVNPGVSKARLTLSGNLLTLTATGLEHVPYPVSIDPSVVVTSATSFQATGNYEGDVDYSTNISTSGLTGGMVGTWSASGSSTGNLQVATYEAASVINNSYVYEIGGCDVATTLSGCSGGDLAEVEYSQLNSGGGLTAPATCASGYSTSGTWCYKTSSLPTATYALSATAYNGYVYVVGGCTSSTTTCTTDVSTTEYSQLNSGGGLTAPASCGTGYTLSGTWCYNTSSLTFTVHWEGLVAYNGNLYEVGGQIAAGGNTTNVYYTVINADGSIGGWNSTSSLHDANRRAATVVYNGYIYQYGGYTTSNNPTTEVQYAVINSNGSLGTWVVSSNSLEQAVQQLTGTVYDGYIYAFGGNNGNNQDYVQYAAINADGTLGAWSLTTALDNGSVTLADEPTSVVYDGYLYVIGGCSVSSCTTVSNVVYYVQVDSPGFPGGSDDPNTPTSLTVATDDSASVVFDGYIYEISGCATACPTRNVEYAEISSNGGLGAWTTITNSLTAASASTFATAVTYNGYLYYMGGCGSTCPNQIVNYTALNSTGGIVNQGCDTGWTTNGAWCTKTTDLPIALQNATSVVYDGYIYEIGGINSSSANIKTVYYAPINSTASIGSWTTLSLSLPLATAEATSVEYDGYVYEMGGCTGGSCSTVTKGVEFSQLSSSGGLIAPSCSDSGWSLSGSWCENTTSLPIAETYPTSVAYNGYVYYIGGESGGVSEGQIDYALINSDGSLGTWTTPSTSMSYQAENATSVVDNGYVYVIGGGDPPAESDVSSNALNNGGGGGFSASSTPGNLFQATYNSSSAAYNGYVYVIGGCASSCPSRIVEYSQFSPGGGLTAPSCASGWTASGIWCYNTTSLPVAIQGATSIVYNGYVYEMGGENASSNGITTVYSVPINANGSLGSWTSTGDPLPTATYQATSVTYNGYVYEIGGCSASCATVRSSVYYSQLSSGGGLTAPGCTDSGWSLSGSWCVDASSLPSATYEAGSVAYDGYVYEIGGEAGGANSSSVYYAPLNSDGSVGTWVLTGELDSYAINNVAVAYNGYLYMGNAIDSVPGTIDVASINGDGSLGSWSSTSLPTEYTSSSFVVYNGYFYQFGGCDAANLPVCSTYSANVYDAGLQSIPRIGYYSDFIDITGAFPSGDTDVQPIEMIMNGTNTGNPGLGGISGPGGIIFKYEFAGYNCATFSTAQTLNTGFSDQLATVFPFSITTNGCSTTTNLGRYLWLHFTLDDSQTATFPDINSNHTTINNFTVYYHPNPGQRLRGGATFEQGSLQSLDAPP